MLSRVVLYAIMFLEDFFMRLSIKPSANSTRLYIVDSYRNSDGKVVTKTIMKCGELSQLMSLYDDPIKHFSDLAKKMTLEKKELLMPLNVQFFQNKSLPLDMQLSFNAGYLFLQKIYYQLKLDKTCSKIADQSHIHYDLNKILRDLIFSRILFPSSKLSTYEISKNFLEQPDYELHDLYRALDILSDNINFIQKETYKHSSSVCNRNTNILYYDCTNYFFEIESEDGFRNYGISKEHRPNPLVQMGLFMDGNGIPLAFNINPGNTNEQVTPLETEKMIEKEFGLSKFIYCSDAGLGSYNIKWFHQLKDRSFIVTQSLKKLKKHLVDWALDDHGWNDGKHIETITDDEIIYKSRPINESGLIEIEGIKYLETINQRLIVTYSPIYASYQKSIREEQIERAKKLLKCPSRYNKHTSTDFKRFIKNITFDKNGEVINQNLTLDYEQIELESQYDGFYALVTNLDDNDEAIIKINHNRWKIEESFRIMKSEFKARPVFLQKENRIKAHFLTCYLALLIFRILEQKINVSSSFSSHAILETLRHFDVFKLKDIGYASNYKASQLSNLLVSIFDLPLNREAYGLSSIKKIISLSKK